MYIHTYINEDNSFIEKIEVNTIFIFLSLTLYSAYSRGNQMLRRLSSFHPIFDTLRVEWWNSTP